MTLYLKYRSRLIDELDLENVRNAFKRISLSKEIPHAFLFSGPKGTGKTSAARILAKIVNCERVKDKKKGARLEYKEPCNKCEQCVSIMNGSNIDIVELDAASHRGIDDIRSLRDAVKLAPAKAKKKVYIIDEAHMLTKEASNALLKTLEEPPDHVIFILATTSPDKLIETIRSRTTSMLFRKANKDELLRSLQRVVRRENLKVKDIKTKNKILEMIAGVSDGSFRDAIKILEQLRTQKVSLNVSSVEKYLYSTRSTDIDKLLSLLLTKNSKDCIRETEDLLARGVTAESLLRLLLGELRESLLAKIEGGEDKWDSAGKRDLISLVKLFTRAVGELRNSYLEQLPLEIAIIEWCEGEIDEGSRPKESPLKDNSKLEDNPSGIKSNTKSAGEKDGDIGYQKGDKDFKGNDEVNDENKINESQKDNSQEKVSRLPDEMWVKILDSVKPINFSIEALLRAAKPIGYDGNTLTLGVLYSFHKERLESSEHRRILEDTIANVIGSPIRIVCKLTPPSGNDKGLGVVARKQSGSMNQEEDRSLTDEEDEDIIKTAKEIFGT